MTTAPTLLQIAGENLLALLNRPEGAPSRGYRVEGLMIVPALYSAPAYAVLYVLRRGDWRYHCTVLVPVASHDGEVYVSSGPLRPPAPLYAAVMQSIQSTVHPSENAPL